MASGIRVTKVDVWAGDLRDQPGGLSRVLDALAGGGGSVECVIARRKESGGGVVFVSPVKGRAVQDGARKVGLRQATDIGTLRVEGADRPGLGHRITQAIADARINMRGLTAAVLNGSFVCYIGFDSSADAARAAKVIKSVKAPSGGKAKKAGRGSSRKAARAKR